MTIFDSHAHYSDEAFDEDRSILLERLPQSGVIGIIGCGSSLQTSKKEIEIAHRYTYYYSAVGIHPEECGNFSEMDITELGHLASEEKVVAIGEIGLDYHYEDNPSKDIQKTAFAKQLELANRIDLPVIIHSRDATEDALNIVKEYLPRGVIHCFSGSAETAAEYISIGMYIGFTGAITFPNSKKAVRAAEAVPLDRLLVETDCPYMAPVPFRGKRSDSSMIAATLEKLAEIKNTDIDTISRITADNAARLFGIKL